jgi:hypothetical protein
MGSIIWQKRTTMRTSGGATVMGSYPYPPSGLVEIDYEHILIFKKPGKGRKVPADIKKGSRLSKDEWKEYFQGHWRFGGARQIGHEAMFPEELPRRLIKMFSFVGETVLDPFIGSGTTAKVALSLKRDAVGYEINKEFVDIIKEKVGSKVNVRTRRKRTRPPKVDYVPGIQDARPESPGRASKTPGETFKVTEVIDHRTLGLSSGRKVKLLGVKVKKAKRKQAVTYLKDRVLKKTIFLRFDQDGSDEAYIYLKNRIFVNSYLIRSGLADPDMSKDFSKKARFAKLKRDRTRELKK